MSLIGGILYSEKAFALPLAFDPLSLIEDRALLNSKTLNLIVNPHSFVNSSISVIVNALPVSPSLFHFPFIPLPIFPDIYTLSLVKIMLPLPQIDISIRILENASPRFLLIFKLPLINFLRGILNFLDVIHKLSIMRVNILLEEGLNDGCFLSEELLGMVH